MEVSADADISGIEVVVSLQDFSPVFESRRVDSQSVVVERVVNDIAVLCSLVDGNGVCLGVYNIEVGTEVHESRAFLEVTELCALVAESEEHISLGIVCVNLGALLIEYRPHSVRTDSDIHYRGRTCDNIAAALCCGVVKRNFAGRNEEAVSRRDIVACGVHSLYGSVVRIAAFDSADKVGIIHAVGCNPDIALIVNREVVVLRGDVGDGNRIREEHTADTHCERHGNFLCTYESLEVAVLIECENAGICSRGNDIHSARVGYAYGNRRKYSIFAHDIRCRCAYGADEVAEQVKYNYSCVLLVADIDVFIVYKCTHRLGEAVGNTVLVIEGGNFKSEFEFAVADNNSVVACIGEVYIHILINEYILRLLELCINSYFIGGNHSVRNIYIRRNARLTVYRVSICRIRGSRREHRDYRTEKEHQHKYAKNSCYFLHYYIYLLLSLSYRK